jgi:hypothetical protein
LTFCLIYVKFNEIKKATDSHGERKIIMQGNNSNDRRLFTRIRKALPIRFLAVGREKECLGQTTDISANGIGLLSTERLSPQTKLEMWLELPNNRSYFYTRGEVVWSSAATNAAEYRTGIRLDKAELMGLAPILWK